MRKRIWLLLLAALMGLLSACALADDYGTAVVDGGNSNRVHLREAPSTEAKSLGLYFTGTQVVCKSDPRGDWIEVKIGRERGYMKAKYLKTGAAADSVTPCFRKGTVTATKYGRLRKGPSTEYQFICNLNNGTNVTVMGETDEHWYYVQAGKETGFISSGLVYVGEEIWSQPVSASTAVPVSTSVPVSTPAWKTAYRKWVAQNGQLDDRYGLIYVDRDSVPELAVYASAEAGGCQILTYSNGRIGILQTRRRGFTYIPRGGTLCNSDGLMDNYYDDVYTLENGAWKRVAYGEYYGYKDGWSEEQGRYICQNYVWNGTPTTMEGYMRSLRQVYPLDIAQLPAFEYSHEEILRALQ